MFHWLIQGHLSSQSNFPFHFLTVFGRKWSNNRFPKCRKLASETAFYFTKTWKLGVQYSPNIQNHETEFQALS